MVKKGKVELILVEGNIDFGIPEVNVTGEYWGWKRCKGVT